MIYDSFSAAQARIEIEFAGEADGQSASALGRSTMTVRHQFWSEGLVKRTAAVTEALTGADSGKARPFRYQWQLSLHFVPGSVREVETSELHVIDFDFSDDTVRQERDAAKATLRPISPPTLDYHQIWRRPLHRLPVHKDVPRLLKGLQVLGPDGETLFLDDGTAKPSDPAAQIGSILALLLALARALDSDEVRCPTCRCAPLHAPARGGPL